MAVDLVGLDLGIADGFKIVGVSQGERDVMVFEQVVQPVPAGGGLDYVVVIGASKEKVASSARGHHQLQSF